MSLQLIIREHEGEVRVSMSREGGYGDNPAGKPRPFIQPFSADELEDLRWYLEDYLHAHKKKEALCIELGE